MYLLSSLRGFNWNLGVKGAIGKDSLLGLSSSRSQGLWGGDNMGAERELSKVVSWVPSLFFKRGEEIPFKLFVSSLDCALAKKSYSSTGLSHLGHSLHGVTDGSGNLLQRRLAPTALTLEGHPILGFWHSSPSRYWQGPAFIPLALALPSHCVHLRLCPKVL